MSSNKEYYKRNNCRYCGSKNLIKFIDLGMHPPSNSFTDKNNVLDEKKFPLKVYFCNNCFLVQLLDVVSADNIFKEYVYLSSSSKALVNHFTKMTKSICKEYKVKPRDIVVDIGCNDGITLNTYPVKDLLKIGVEPSDVAGIAKKSGLNIINKFFNKNVTKEIIETFGRAKVVTATNVFAIKLDRIRKNPNIIAKMKYE